MTAPKVSVICIFWNEEKFLAEAIESVLAQDFGDYELLLADDGSTDASARIAGEYVAMHPDRLFYLHHPGHANRGMSATRNLGLAHARGEYVAMLDGDDVWPSGKLSEQAAILDANPDVGMVSGGLTEWFSWAGGKDDSWLTGPVSDGKSFPPATTLKVYPLGRSCNPTNPMIRRSVVEKVGGYEDSFPGLYEDQAFLAKIYLETGVYWSTRIWLKYRRHPASCTMRQTWPDYVAARTRFLDWFSGYIAERDPAGRRAMERAIRLKRWELRHRYLAFAWRRSRRFVLAAARLFGADHLYRRYRHGGG
jgi:glycosyltransferase involved in cell wall biosynthesis